MSDTSNMGAAAEGAPKSAGDGNAKVDGQIVRMLVRAIWMQEWMLANPEGTAGCAQGRLEGRREATMEKNLKPYRRAVRALAFSGVTINLSDEAPDGDDTA